MEPFFFLQWIQTVVFAWGFMYVLPARQHIDHDRGLSGSSWQQEQSLKCDAALNVIVQDRDTVFLFETVVSRQRTEPPLDLLRTTQSQPLALRDAFTSQNDRCCRRTTGVHDDGHRHPRRGVHLRSCVVRSPLVGSCERQLNRTLGWSKLCCQVANVESKPDD